MKATVVAVFAAAAAAGTVAAGSPSVSTWINTTWAAPPVYLQTLEFLAASGAQRQSVFALAGQLAARGFSASAFAAALGGDSEARALLGLALATHAAAPAVAARFAYYDQVVRPRAPVAAAACPAWVAWRGEAFCAADVAALDAALAAAENTENTNEPLLPGDHVHGAAAAAARLVLYADLRARDFLALHAPLMAWADAGRAQVVLRYKPVDSAESRDPLYLSGYGVELAIKSTEYKVIDDRSTDAGAKDKSDQAQADDASDSAKVSANDGPPSLFVFDDEEEAVMKSLAAEDIKEIGVKAANIVLTAESPLDALIQVSQDFPKYSHLIAKRPVSPQQRMDLRHNQRSIVNAGTNLFLLNGIQMGLKDMNIFSLLTAMRKELGLIRSLQTLSLTADEAVRLLSLPSSTAASDSDLGWGDAFDVRDESVVWWNDLEHDKRYKQFPRSLQDLLQPSYPGQLKYVAKNMFHVLFVLDLTNIDHLLIQVDIFKFIEHSVPLRFGLLPLIGDKDSSGALLAARAFLRIIKTHGRKEARDFILTLLKEIKANENKSTKDSVVSIVETAFESVASSGFVELMESNEDAEVLAGYRKLLNRIGMNGNSGALFLNGKFIDLDENWQQNMLAPYPKMLQFLQMKVYEGVVVDKQNIYDFFMTQPNVHQRRNPYIFPSEDHPLRFVDFLGKKVDSKMLKSLSYVSEREGAVVSIIVIADFESSAGLRLAQSSLEFISTSPQSRVSFIHNPSLKRITTLSTRTLLHKAVKLLVTAGSSTSITSTLVDAIKALGEGDFNFAGNGKLFDQGDVDSGADNGEFEKWSATATLFAKNVVGFKDGEAGVIVNGRVVGPFANPELFTDEDMELLTSNEYRDRIEKIDDALTAMTLGGVSDKAKWISDAVMKISALTADQSSSDVDSDGEKGRTSIEWGENSYGLTIGNAATSSLRFTVVLDPLTEIAQKTSSILKVLSKLPGVSIKLLLNPATMLEDLPIKRFYRYVLHEDVQYDSQGRRVAPQALFKNIPVEPLLTLGLDVPRAWVVRASDSIHDLDNIKLDSLKPGQNVESYFQLNHILVEGHAREVHSSTPPRGVQFVLGTPATPHMVDTITMTNLGYLQLKANPGIWQMRLREGRSSEVYQIESVSEKYSSKAQDDAPLDGYATVVVDTFEGVTIYPVVKKRPGMEKEDVLEPNEIDKRASATAVARPAATATATGVWDQLKSRVWGSKDTSVQSVAAPTSNATINIFSIASGHLYERFMGIMMLSVMRNTKSPVKFWLIENFLSPKFMNFVPHLAKAYNFEYEFITYNWPHWLRATTRKERTIWAYKILFLDVLFPLNLDKVIFVDADQVVRVDMKELVDLDLEGAVYGYTPMGDSRPEMEGFRFWKTGYWAGHLQGRPYHISALYVIDLKRFRQLLAGDRLRQQYQMLSADPNSLANLDQDLPNNMIHEIPIFSLPKEWLWCETWCSDAELKTAKTIDLCNNPLTKEPKLKRAKRIIKEWVELDNLVQAVADRVEAEQRAQHDEL
ncbi:UDP-glucose:glycoprotein glucosyltransferase-domain-containing protein [Obelidium mucronatum]|nr:UDP-glucose:glycoprotein glucosyltransferase-domain-containing protein [Obelidium mucronatum]